MPSLTETFRPSRLADVAGHARTKAAIERLAKRASIGGRAYWLTGAPGIGKTTLARILAGMVADPALSTLEIDAGRLTPSALDDWLWTASSRSLLPPHGWALILNEAHGLRLDTLRTLLVALEALPPWALVAFTTTPDGMASFLADKADSDPLLQRCIRFDLEAETTAFAERARAVAIAIGEDGRAPLDYEILVASCGGSLREAIQKIDMGEAFND